MGSPVRSASSGPVVDAHVSARIALRCSFCRAALVRGEVVFCAACLAPHHAECVREHGRCSAAGCGERQVVRPDSAQSRVRRWLERVVLFGFVVLGAHGVLAQREEARELERRATAQSEAITMLGGKLIRGREAITMLGRKLTCLEEDRRRRLAEQARLTCELVVEEQFRRLVHMLQQVDGLEELVEQSNRVRQAIDQAEHVVSESTRDRWKVRLGELGEGKRWPYLQDFIQDGNRALRQVVAATNAADWDRVDLGLRAIRGIVYEMRCEEREVFHRNADALEERARVLRERATARR